MTQKTMVIDLDRCIGCFACEVACKQENNVALGVYYIDWPDGEVP